VGRTEPRLWTPPLRELTPATSYGFSVCEFAERIERPLDDWQRWLAIHAGEMLPDGRPRFRRILVLVARQNGKTELLVVLTLFWLYEQKIPLILSTSTTLEYAKAAWQRAVDIAEETDELAERIPARGGIRYANGEQALTTTDKCTYKIAAKNRRAGRSLTVHRFVADEVREHDSWDAYHAGVNAMNAVPNAQAFFISNQGDSNAVVLRALRKSALEFIKTGQGDPRLGIFEWSAPDGAEADDPVALSYANPNLNHSSGRNPLDALLGEAFTAKTEGGEALAKFKIEVLCQDVPTVNAAIDPDKWRALAGDVDMADLRDRIAACVDVSPDGQHATLVAAAVDPAGLVRVEVVKAWHGQYATRALRRELPGLVAKVKPRVLGWYPAGPAAVVAADLADPKKRGGRRNAVWPPRGVKVEEIRAEIPAVCMGFADLVDNAMIVHPDDDLLNLHAESAQKFWIGETWRFARRGSGPIDATYAAAGAVHLARTLPAPVGRPRLVVAK
jgi:hypothetical protein